MSQQPPPPGPWLGQVHTPPPEPRRRSPWPLLLGLAALVIVGLAVGALLLGGQGPAATATPIAGSPPATAQPATAQPGTGQPGSPAPGSPSPTAAPSPAGTPTQATPSPASPTPGASPPDGGVGRTPPPDIAAQIDEVVAQVPPIRELEPLRDVPYILLTRDEFQTQLEEILAEEVDPDELAIEGRLLERLGLLPEDTDLYDLLLQLYGSQVAAFYRPDTSSFYIIERDSPFGPVDRMIVAHEYTHALQDQHFDLEGTRIADPSEGDAVLAQLAAIEGDASLLMYEWAFSTLSLREQLELFSGMMPTPTDQELLEGMPPILQRQLAFPYNEGFLFSTEVQRQGGWAAVDETLSTPPASTEQILHADKYFAGEQPIRVELPDLAGVGDGLEDVYQQTMGELNVQVWLADGETPPMPGLPAPSRPWQDAAAGWGGDRLAMYENEVGDWVIVWQTAWDSATDAAEFEAMATGLLPGLGGPSELVTVSRGSTPYVTVLVASDAALLGDARTAIR